MELVKPKGDVEVIVFKETHNLLEILEILAVDIDVLADDLVPLAQLLRRFLSIRKRTLSVTLRLGFEVRKTVYS